MQFVCVVNPVSGKGKALPVAEEIANMLRQNGHDVEIIQTSPDIDDFTEACRKITPEKRVICFGGDGTLLYYLNACGAAKAVAFYGMGTANVITHEFKLPRKPSAFVKMLEADHRISIRPGLAQDGSRFLMMCSFGIDGYVLTKVTQSKKNKGGKRAFLWPTLKGLYQYNYPNLRVVVDGDQVLEGTWVIVSRIKRYGGPYKAAPKADPMAPASQVVVFKGRGFWRTLFFFVAMFFGRHLSLRSVVTADGEHVRVEAPDDLHCQMDGDYWEGGVNELTVSGDTISFIVP